MDFRGFMVLTLLTAALATIIIGLGSALMPLLAAFVMAYLLFPVIQRIERVGLKRHYTVFVVFLGCSLFTLILLAVIIPNLLEDARSLLQEMPNNLTLLLGRIETLADEHGYVLHLDKESVQNFALEHTSVLSTTLLKGATNFFKGMLGNTLSWLLALLNLFLIPLFFFYLINDFEKIIEGLRSWIPPAFRPKISHYITLSNRVLNGYIRGQFLVAGILSLLYGLGLSLIGLRFGFLVGLVSGLLSIIPYAGFTIGFVTSLLIGVANYNGMGGILAIVAVFTVVQALEGTVITPRLVGNQVGLNALTTMLALIIGGNLFGIVGMLIAIPVTAVLKTILLELKQEYQNLDVYQ